VVGRAATAEPRLSLARASVFFDGSATSPRLRHPECVAVDAQGDVWCGGEEGEVYRIAADGSRIELVASSGGATLGIAFDDAGHLFVCDARAATLDRLDVATGRLERFARERAGRMRVPNFPVVDLARGCIYVSDSWSFDEAGPGIWRFDLVSGQGELWYDQPLRFANGMALDLDGDALFVAETFARRVVRIPIDTAGRAGAPEPVVEAIERLPDGLAVDVEGNLYISCYEPSRLYRLRTDMTLELLIDDPEAHMLCHPTNCAFRGRELLTANLGRCHVTRFDVGIEGAALPLGSPA
jgi:gluconolactonase